jgi:hypothetical protein
LTAKGLAMSASPEIRYFWRRDARHLFAFELKWQRFLAIRLADLDDACMLRLENLPPTMVIPRCQREIGSFDFQPWAEVSGAIPR